jgi:hypothetical protein
VKPVDCERLHLALDGIEDRDVTASDKAKVRRLAKDWASKQERPSDTLSMVLEQLGLLC